MNELLAAVIEATDTIPTELMNLNNAVTNEGNEEMITTLTTGETAPNVAPAAPAPAKKKTVAKKKKPAKKVEVVALPEAPVAIPMNFGGYDATPEEVELGVIEQIRVALKNPLAAFAGFVLGGFVPVATFSISHLDKTLNEYVMWALVIGGLIYSALTVFGWAKLAFNNGLKALGFVVLIEGVMTLSGLPMLSYSALALLVLINGIATGATLSIKGGGTK